MNNQKRIKNKVILILVAFICLIGLGFVLRQIQQENAKPVHAKDNIILEYGSKIPNETFIENYLDVKEPDQVTISVNLDELDTSKIVKNKKGRVDVTVDGTVYTLKLKYSVEDTQLPIIMGPFTLITPYGMTPDYASLFKAYDLVDGTLTVEAMNELDATKPGKQDITIAAKDLNNNVSEHKVTISVKEENTATLGKPEKVAVFGYHGVAQDAKKESDYKNNIYWVSTSQFDREMKAIVDEGYTAITLKEFEDWYLRGGKIPEKSVLITFDDGIREGIQEATPILEKYKLSAVSFNIMKSLEVDNNYGLRMEDLLASGHVFEHQSHSYDLHYALERKDGAFSALAHSDIERIKDDFKKTESIYKPRYMAYPYGSHSPKVTQMLEEFDYKLGFLFSSNRSERRLAMPKDGPWAVRRVPVLDNTPIEIFVKTLKGQYNN
ncbi:MAG: polysaccharide deacetylase family protein [Erysipelothrix sp.]